MKKENNLQPVNDLVTELRKKLDESDWMAMRLRQLIVTHYVAKGYWEGGDEIDRQLWADADAQDWLLWIPVDHFKESKEVIDVKSESA